MPRPHFAYVFERFPSFTQTFCAREVLELQRQGTRLLLFSIRSTGEETLRHFPQELIDQVITLPPADVLTREVEAMKERRELPQSMVLTLREWSGRPDKARIYEAAWIGQKLRAAGVRHVHTHFAGLAARTAWWIRQFYGLSYSFTGHANDLFCPDEATGLKLPRLIQDAAAVIAVSDYTAAWLRENHPAAASRIHRVYNGLDLDPITQATAGTVKITPPLIFSVGRLIEKKGFDDLIRACALLRDQGLPFQCRITGDGPLQDALASQIQTAGLSGQVTLTGPLSQPDIIQQLGHATVFALPCVTEADGGRDVLPTVLMEAMAAALPCVSTTLAGVPEMVLPEKTGLLVPERDPAGTAAALTRIITDRALAQRFGQAGLALARERFAKDVTAAHLRQVLTSSGKVNGPPTSLPLAAAYLRQFLRRFSKPLRSPASGKTAVFP
ncbi:MAG: glycosyltransferase family 4 protein [Verrucomicrobiota bacterium]